MFVPKILKILSIIFVGMVSASFASDEGVPYGNNPQAGHYAQVNGIKIYYEIYGKGEPLVLIHGNSDSIAGMAAQIAHFSPKYKVIVADSRGHGKSGLGTDHLNYPQMLEDWNGLLDYLKVKQARLFGWSDGGILGLLMAIKHPDKVSRLAIMGANLRPDETAVQPWAKPMLAEAVRQVDAMIAKKDTSENWDIQRQLLDLIMTQPNIAVKDLHKINIPVLVMAGDRDVIREEHTIEIFQNLKKAHLAILPGHTHFAPATDPEMFNRLLDDFFEKPFTMPTTKEIMESFF